MKKNCICLIFVLVLILAYIIYRRNKPSDCDKYCKVEIKQNFQKFPTQEKWLTKKDEKKEKYLVTSNELPMSLMYFDDPRGNLNYE